MHKQYLFNIDKLISDSVTFRPVSLFATDIEPNKEKQTEEIKCKKVCVIGGAGSIGSGFTKVVLPTKMIYRSFQKIKPVDIDRRQRKSLTTSDERKQRANLPMSSRILS